MAMMDWKVPNRCPRVSSFPDLAAQGIIKLTYAPLTNPKTRENMIIPAWDGWLLKGIQKQNTDTPVRTDTIVITLKYPSLSATWPGMMRPGMDAALSTFSIIRGPRLECKKDLLNDGDEIDTKGRCEALC